MPTFTPGATCYLLDGRECQYQTGDGKTHVVCSLYDTEHGQELGHPQVVDQVFSTPPTERLHAEIEDLETRRAALAKEVRELAQATHVASMKHTQRMAELQQFAGLERLEDFMRGNISHFVTWSEYLPGQVRIQTFDEAMRANQGSPREQRLLCLFGTKYDGRVAWKINRHCDGSGNWTMCIPCTSLEQAQQIARDQVSAVLENLFSAKDSRPWTWTEALDTAVAMGIAPPDGMREEQRNYRIGACRVAVVKAKTALEEARQALAEAAGIPHTTPEDT